MVHNAKSLVLKGLLLLVTYYKERNLCESRTHLEICFFRLFHT